NMMSIGLDLAEWIDRGLLRVFVSRATRHDLEMHLANLEEAINEFDPQLVVIDPVSNLLRAGPFGDVLSMVSRLVDLLKSRGVTAMFTVLSKWGGGEYAESLDVSSVMDAWIQLRNQEANGENTRLLSIAKARGMAHSNQVREFVITANEIQLVDVYVAGGEVLTGSARLARLEENHRESLKRRHEAERTERELARRRSDIENQMAALKTELERIDDEHRENSLRRQQEAASRESERSVIARERWAEGEMEERSGGDKGKSE
ncbi:MAG: ATPase domain-containing protein, partial [Spirochaetota bacterium]